MDGVIQKGVFYFVYPEINPKWVLSLEGRKMHKILSGHTASLEWGDRAQYVFLKRQNIPVILVVLGDEVPLVFREYPLCKKVCSRIWKDTAEESTLWLDSERVAATILDFALQCHAICRKYATGPGLSEWLMVYLSRYGVDLRELELKWKDSKEMR
jgi:hypothetical protein